LPEIKPAAIIYRQHPMKRAVIYARFSTDHQDERSIEDQVALCRDYAKREQLNVIEVFEDRARSGASIQNRDGLLALMDSAKDNAFDVVVVEALDRLSRDMEDLASIHKRLTYPASRSGPSMKALSTRSRLACAD
jgi:site-specific DNA recombinase